MRGPDNSPGIAPHFPLDMDLQTEREIQSNCGLFAAIDVSDFPGGMDLKSMTLLAGASLQHRAEGAAGYVVFDGIGARTEVKGKDTIAVAFQNGRRIPEVPDSRIAILHTRYPTAGASDNELNIQPLFLDGITFAHHGNLTNARQLHGKMPDIQMGGENPDNDSWIALNLLVRSEGQTLEEKMTKTVRDLEGGFALIASDGNGLVASRDPEGIRPLYLGRIGPVEDPQSYVLSVETSPFSGLGVTEYREVEPGETISIRGKKVATVQMSPALERRSCVFEVVYMMHPDSEYMGQQVYDSRRKAGHALFREQPVDLEDGEKMLVMPVPDSGRSSALGFFKEARENLGAQVDYDEGLLINRYIGRNFIKPTGKRSPSAKFFEIETIVSGHNIVLVDDSLVRGETMAGIVKMLKDGGAKSVHVRIASPEVVRPCHWGVAIPTYEELSAYKLPNLRSRAKELGIDSLGHISLNGLFEACGADEKTKEDFCAYCFGGNGPKMSNGENSGSISLLEGSQPQVLFTNVAV